MRSELPWRIPFLLDDSRPGLLFNPFFFPRLDTWLSREVVEDRKKLATRWGILQHMPLPMAGEG
jgi:hypothetical protein